MFFQTASNISIDESGVIREKPKKIGSRRIFCEQCFLLVRRRLDRSPRWGLIYVNQFSTDIRPAGAPVVNRELIHEDTITFPKIAMQKSCRDALPVDNKYIEKISSVGAACIFLYSIQSNRYFSSYSISNSFSTPVYSSLKVCFR